ncbi:MAG: hypothetical protein JRH11_00080 [Deltaproteobacteria bacterium]|nr:hypothetical protein [Deltaproteobacteria bacterium]
MTHLTRIFLVAFLVTSAVASTGLAQDAPNVRVIEEATVVRATQQSPAAFYVLRRSRHQERPSELRQSFVREVVRSTRSLR